MVQLFFNLKNSLFFCQPLSCKFHFCSHCLFKSISWKRKVNTSKLRPKNVCYLFKDTIFIQIVKKLKVGCGERM